MKWLMIASSLWSFTALAAEHDLAAYQRMIADRATDSAPAQKVEFALEYFDTLSRVGSAPVSFTGCLKTLSTELFAGKDPCTPVGLRVSARAGSGTGGVD
jgi:hypothetical protein